MHTHICSDEKYPTSGFWYATARALARSRALHSRQFAFRSAAVLVLTAKCLCGWCSPLGQPPESMATQGTLSEKMCLADILRFVSVCVFA